MKAGWQTKRLADFAVAVSTGPFGSLLHKSDYVENGVPLVNPINIVGDAIIPDPTKLVGDATIRRLSSYVLREGDVVVGRRGEIGRCAVVGPHESGWVCGTGSFFIRPLPSINSHFLAHLLRSGGYRQKLEQVSTGATMKNLSNTALGDLTISVPSFLEQKRIVGILDEAFEAIATAKTNAERNLANAREVFQSAFVALTAQSERDRWFKTTVADVSQAGKNSIRTGPFGSQLLHSEFVEEGVAVLGIDNVVDNVFRWGKKRFITPEKFRELSRYQVKPGDVLITIMGTCGRCAVVPDDIPLAINTKHLCCITLERGKCLPEFLHAYFLYHPAAQQFLAKQAKGAIMAGLNMQIIKELPLVLPPIAQQEAIVAVLKVLQRKSQRLESIYQHKLDALDELKQSLLQRAFAGELTTSEPPVIPISAAAGERTQKAERGLTTTDLHAGILALAYRAHERAGTLQYFGHVKAEKVAHMVEARLGIDLGRAPVKDAAGPNDYPHLMKVEHRARNAQFFDFRRDGSRYVVSPLPGFDRLIERTRDDLGERYEEVEQLIELMAKKMDTEQAEIVATVYAAWNNLLLDELPATDEDIVRAAREDWHPDKLKIKRDRFFKAIEWMRYHGLVPDGTGSRVTDKPAGAKRGRKRR